MTISDRVKRVLTGDNFKCFTISGGYACSYDDKIVRLPECVTEIEKRNDNGRVIHSRYRYADNSTLTYRYNVNTEIYTLTSKASA